MYVRPSLDDMLIAGGGTLHVSATEFLVSLGWARAELEPLRSEYAAVADRLVSEYGRQRDALPFPASFRVEEETSFFLYAAVRLARPQTVVETGVANGHSSFLILAALEHNASGRLYSFDIDGRSGALVGECNNWSLTISQENKANREFARAITQIGTIDLFFHDADHRYLSQLFEYRTVWPAMRDGGVFISDDVDDSRAFFDFCEQLGCRPSLLFDRTKVVGAYRVP